MENRFLVLVSVGFILLSILCLVFIFLGVKKALQKMNLPKATRRKKLGLATLAVVLWLVVVSMLSFSGFLADFSSRPPKFFIIIIIPLIIILYLAFNKSFNRFLAYVPNQWLVNIQVFRVPVEIFLWLLFLDNLIPIQMTFEGLNWDVLTGMTAPIFGYLCFRNGKIRKNLAIAWNILGLLLLINIVAVAMLSAPTPFRVFMNEPANTIVTQFPIVFLPALLVPIAYSMHIFSLRQLMRKKTA